MKPLSLTADRRRDSFGRAVGRYGRLPLTDYGYHSVAFEGFGERYLCNPAQPFWNIARNYLKHEARQEFWCEAALFAFITITAALPLINNMHALIEFVRAVTSH
jgi:hypothetical protein